MTTFFVIVCLAGSLPLAFTAWVLYMDHQSRWRSRAAMTVAGLAGSVGLGIAAGPLLGAPIALFAAVATGWFAGLLRGVPMHLILYPLVGLILGLLYPDDGAVCLWECAQQGPSTAQGTAGVAFGVAVLLTPAVAVTALLLAAGRLLSARKALRAGRPTA